MDCREIISVGCQSHENRLDGVLHFLAFDENACGE